MLERHHIALALGALALATAASACAGGSDTVPGTGGSATTSSSGSTGGGTTSSSASSGGAGGTGGAPVSACKPSDDVVLAVKQLYFGDTNWDDTMNTTEGWKQYGLDIDGKTSVATSTDLCLPAGGGAASVAYPDAPGGVDNSFGKNVLPVFLQNIPILSQQANNALANGDFSILIRLVKLGPGAEQGNIPAKVYGGAYLPTTPFFDGTDCWPATPESLSTPTDIESAKLSFPASTMTLNRWDSVSTGDLELTLQLLGFQGKAIIHHARIVMELDADHKGTQKGIISGVLDTEEFVAAINQLMFAFDPKNCSGNTPIVQEIDTKLRQASDIMADGTQNPAATCTGISIGLGFKAAAVQFGPIGDPLVPPADPCATP
ncbi:Hypothetical protein A7982_00958 [Minicystis rosea]|nr:Hypothetical protein A7982_00958 [Minicystis rosea]